MKHAVLFVVMISGSFILHAATEKEQLQQQVQQLKRQSQQLQAALDQLQKEIEKPQKKNTDVANKKAAAKKSAPVSQNSDNLRIRTGGQGFHSAPVRVHSLDAHPESMGFYPTALIADEHVVTYIAGTPVVTSPYLGDRPAFDGSDYIVNISSINRDIRLMQQRRRLYNAYQKVGYPVPHMPIMALSGKVEPVGLFSQPYFGNNIGNLTLGASELDVAAALNDMVEGYMSIAYDESAPFTNGQRVANSSFFLNMGFVNIGNLEKSPLYFTAGQLFVPFGRYSSAMVSAPLTMRLTRTRTRPFILGYKSQKDTGPFAAAFAFKSDTTLGNSTVGGLNLGYVYDTHALNGEIGASYISSINDSTGMQHTGAIPETTFAGFASFSHGSEAVRKIPGVSVHGNLRFDRYNLTAEWVGATQTFRREDLSFNGIGAKPQAAQVEAAMTFMAFDKPASIAAGYQWSRQALALNLPAQRLSGVFNISLWKDTVESLEYRHDIDYKRNQYANGASPANAMNVNTVGTGRSSDTLLAQIGVYF